MRVRRAVLGEIKERKEGGLYYTKPFRELMNCILDIDDFFSGTLKSENAKNPSYFYRQLMSFYKSAAFVAKCEEQIVEDAVITLDELKISLEKEISDLKRYRQRIGTVEVYVYADRIQKRMTLLSEIEKVLEKVRFIGENGTAFSEFYDYLRGEKNFSALGSGEDFVDVIRFFYKETVKKTKLRFGMKNRSMYPSDAYALCQVCSLLGKTLTPKYAFVFVDEAQDISAGEYELPDFEVFTLNQNYRNTNQIVDFVASALKVDMQSIGFDGPEVQHISPRGISAFFRDKKGLKAVICSEKNKDEYIRKAYSVVSEKGRISRTRINLMTVYESKGLEFTSVAVIPDNMTPNEKYIAYTRALKELAIVDRVKGEKE